MALTTIDDRGLKTPIDLIDNEKIRFGTGNDLEIYHDGSNNVISGTVNNWIKSTGTQGFTAGSDYQLTCVADGAVNLYYDNAKKLETTSVGAQITGRLVLDGGYLHISGSDLYIDDSRKAYFGAGSDIQIYHDGSNSYITNSTGQFAVQGDDLKLRSTTDLENYIVCTYNGSVDLYHNGSLISATGSAHLDQYARIKIHASNSGGFGGHQMAIGEWDGANHRIEGDANRPIFITSYNSGGVKLGVSGSNEVTVTGDGLTFNGDTAAANALDDYEEGSWTPTVPGGGTMNIYNASYTKVGRLVTWWTYIYITSIPNNSTGFTIGGFPFTSGSTSNMGGSAVCAYSGSLDTSDFGFYKNTGDTNISCYLIGGGSVGGTILNSHIQGATRYFALSGQYYT